MTSRTFGERKVLLLHTLCLGCIDFECSEIVLSHACFCLWARMRHDSGDNSLDVESKRMCSAKKKRAGGERLAEDARDLDEKGYIA